MGKRKGTYSLDEVNTSFIKQFSNVGLHSLQRAYAKRLKQLEQQEVMPNFWIKHHDAYLSHLETALKRQLVQCKNAVPFWSDFTTELCEACRVSKDSKTFREAQEYYQYLKILDDQVKNPYEPTIFEPEFKTKLRKILQIFPVFLPKSECSSSGLLTSTALPGSTEHCFNRSDLNLQLLDFLQPLVNDKTIAFKKVTQVVRQLESMETYQLKLFLGMPLDQKVKEVKKIARRPLKSAGKNAGNNGGRDGSS